MSKRGRDEDPEGSVSENSKPHKSLPAESTLDILDIDVTAECEAPAKKKPIKERGELHDVPPP